MAATSRTQPISRPQWGPEGFCSCPSGAGTGASSLNSSCAALVSCSSGLRRSAGAPSARGALPVKDGAGLLFTAVGAGAGRAGAALGASGAEAALGSSGAAGALGAGAGPEDASPASAAPGSSSRGAGPPSLKRSTKESISLFWAMRRSMSSSQPAARAS